MTDPLKTAWARTTRNARAALDLNQTEFGSLFGVTPKAVRDWEHGRTLPSAVHRERLVKLAVDLGIVVQ